jgi:hypothetical protein
MSDSKPASTATQKPRTLSPHPRIAIDPSGYTDANDNPMTPPLTSSFKVWGNLTPSGLSGTLSVSLILNGNVVSTWPGTVADHWFVLVNCGSGGGQNYTILASYNSGVSTDQDAEVIN